MNTRYIPQNSTEISMYNGTVYTFTNKNGKPAAIAYTGKSSKPYFHYFFATEERRTAKIEEFFNGRKATENFKQEMKQERKAFVHGFKVGDILSGSWGYEQTNREFFQVVEVTAKSIIIREIAQKAVDGTQGFMCENRIPTPDNFIGTPRRAIVKPQTNGKGLTSTYVGSTPNSSKVRLSEWDGNPEYASWYA